MDASLYHSKLGLNNTKFAPHRFINLQYFRHVAFGKGAVTKATVVTSICHTQLSSLQRIKHGSLCGVLLYIVVFILHSILMEKKSCFLLIPRRTSQRKARVQEEKHKHRNKKKSKKVKSSSSSLDIESDNTRTESKNSKASNERIKHLTEFLDDRKQLHEQLFSIIPKKEVKDMMPDILKVLQYIM
ncbi:hypothetical protein OS493_021952 [Desmophyllum pertusum]|uniref:Uncharacterized protein n=1 Tax=Desmophyllum pertusum TaxID=174260 RepID=A0A9W9ZBX2_9CNID|nr:hypothetical protein OS493_021952 [Desmophyllum pertusum]